MRKLALILTAFLALPAFPAEAAEQPPPITGGYNASGQWDHRYDAFVVEVRSNYNRWTTCTVKITGVLMDTRNILTEYRTVTRVVVFPPSHGGETLYNYAQARLANASWRASCFVHQDRWKS